MSFPADPEGMVHASSPIELSCEICGGDKRPFLLTKDDVGRCVDHLPPWPKGPSLVDIHHRETELPPWRRSVERRVRRKKAGEAKGEAET